MCAHSLHIYKLSGPLRESSIAGLSFAGKFDSDQ